MWEVESITAATTAPPVSPVLLARESPARDRTLAPRHPSPEPSQHTQLQAQWLGDIVT